MSKLEERALFWKDIAQVAYEEMSDKWLAWAEALWHLRFEKIGDLPLYSAFVHDPTVNSFYAFAEDILEVNGREALRASLVWERFHVKGKMEPQVMATLGRSKLKLACAHYLNDDGTVNESVDVKLREQPPPSFHALREFLAKQPPPPFLLLRWRGLMGKILIFQDGTEEMAGDITCSGELPKELLNSRLRSEEVED